MTWEELPAASNHQGCHSRHEVLSCLGLEGKFPAIVLTSAIRDMMVENLYLMSALACSHSAQRFIFHL